MHGQKLDEIDIRILELMQKQGRIKRGNLAEITGLTIPSISERLHKLEENGYICGYHAILNATKVGLGVSAFIFLTSESSKYYPEIINKAGKRDEILECHAITGDGSHLLKVRVQSTAELEKLLSDIQSWPGVKNTRTDIVLSSPKESIGLPLKHLRNELSK
jgi:Lrp/AsnC family leucine-responsive transcriptional regulator